MQAPLRPMSKVLRKNRRQNSDLERFTMITRRVAIPRNHLIIGNNLAIHPCLNRRRLSQEAIKTKPTRVTRRFEELPTKSSQGKSLDPLVPSIDARRSKVKTPSKRGIDPSNDPQPIESIGILADCSPTAFSKLPEPLKTGSSRKSRATKKSVADCDLARFDRFVTVGVPPSQNPSMYERKIARFILDSRLKFPDAILLTCVGSFYEAYFDQAIEVAQLLNIKQAKYQFSGQSYPFSGFPTSSLQKHLKTLVHEHKRSVAIAEQVEISKDCLERRIVRILTPGTITDEDLIDNIDSHNYLLAIQGTELAWLDVSTGSYFRASCDENELLDYIYRISPKEILVSESRNFVIPSSSKVFKLSILLTQLKSSDNLTPEEMISNYVEQDLLLTPQFRFDSSHLNFSRHLKLDSDALDGLEILMSQNGKSSSCSLLSTVSRTITKPGKRLLRDRLTLSTPSALLNEIEMRLDFVQTLVLDQFWREELQDKLYHIKNIDYIRLLQRFNLKQASVNDLLLLVKSRLGDIPDLEQRILKVFNSPTYVNEPSDQSLTGHTANEECKDLFTLNPWTIRSDYSEQLVSLHRDLETVLESGRVLQNEYQNLLGSGDSRLQVVPKFGAILSIPKSRRQRKDWKDILEKQIKGQKLIENGTRILAFTPEWTTLYAKIESLKEKIHYAERDILHELFDEVISGHIFLKRAFENLSELDVFQSFATFAVETGCVRPIVTLEKSSVIYEGRHPIAEQALVSSINGVFQPNSLTMKSGDGLFQIITGPNNGGKSTFLRQVALAHVLAQAGSFVPAKTAVLGLVTRIFTRFGSHDNLVQGKGTFLVEMEETAKILKNATETSLVVMDEVGRGTGDEDGLPIAYGVVKYLLEKIKCRTLFATHLHELGPLLIEGKAHNTNMDPYLKVDPLGFFCTGSTTLDANGRTVLHFPHRVLRGLNSDSRGIDIAQVAGLPLEVIKKAIRVKKTLMAY
ncbi:hypothetical protein O181_046594 [Austropuccinia psidii MF-1]|uniref:DNA mismatch repair proteins mutS family domain-containing protein n=1 Tax=Austropuccinia psidii MF-1 TaxID=1389203 RepID=A0A9Q3DPE2_9BASI|nr:hypothetical protein [Austropuccinia psidii MF-1]